MDEDLTYGSMLWREMKKLTPYAVIGVLCWFVRQQQEQVLITRLDAIQYEVLQQREALEALKDRMADTGVITTPFRLEPYN